MYMHAHQQTAVSMALHPPKVWEWFVNDIYSIFKRIHLKTLLKRNNGYMSVYRKSVHTDKCLHCSSHHQTSCKENIDLSCLVKHIPLSPIKMIKPKNKATKRE